MAENFLKNYLANFLSETVNLSEKLRLEMIVVGFEKQGRHSLSFLNEIYRIIQELLQNSIKHAQATQATVEVVENENHVSITVEDNGIGISENKNEPGKGLSSIRAKVTYLNGQMEISSAVEGGTLVVIDRLSPTLE